MKIEYSHRFKKNYQKRIVRNNKLNKQFKKRLRLFLNTPNYPLLRDHALTGELSGFRSFSITGDVRLIYQITKNSLIFYDIGTHNQLYR